jgi:hypothetical protein
MYSSTLIELRKRIKIFRTQKNPPEILLMQESARSHKFEDPASHHKLSWKVLFQPSYRHDLAPSDFHLLRAMSTKLEDNVICAVIS